MRSWNSALNGVLVRSARSTHSSPSTLRRVFMPRSWASRLMSVPSGKMSREPVEQLVDRRLEALRIVGLARAVGREIGRHARAVDLERGGDRVEEIEGGAEAFGDLGYGRELRLPAAQRSLVLREGSRMDGREEARHARRRGDRM